MMEPHISYPVSLCIGDFAGIFFSCLDQGPHNGLTSAIPCAVDSIRITYSFSLLQFTCILPLNHLQYKKPYKPAQVFLVQILTKACSSSAHVQRVEPLQAPFFRSKLADRFSGKWAPISTPRGWKSKLVFQQKARKNLPPNAQFPDVHGGIGPVTFSVASLGAHQLRQMRVNNQAIHLRLLHGPSPPSKIQNPNAAVWILDFAIIERSLDFASIFPPTRRPGRRIYRCQFDICRMGWFRSCCCVCSKSNPITNEASKSTMRARLNDSRKPSLTEDELISWVLVHVVGMPRMLSAIWNVEAEVCEMLESPADEVPEPQEAEQDRARID